MVSALIEVAGWLQKGRYIPVPNSFHTTWFHTTVQQLDGTVDNWLERLPHRAEVGGLIPTCVGFLRGF